MEGCLLEKPVEYGVLMPSPQLTQQWHLLRQAQCPYVFTYIFSEKSNNL